MEKKRLNFGNNLRVEKPINIDFGAGIAESPNIRLRQSPLTSPKF